MRYLGISFLSAVPTCESGISSLLTRPLGEPVVNGRTETFRRLPRLRYTRIRDAPMRFADLTEGNGRTRERKGTGGSGKDGGSGVSGRVVSA